MAGRRVDRSTLTPMAAPKLSAKDGSGRDVVFDDQDDIPAPDWALTLVESHNQVLDQLEDLESSVAASGIYKKTIKILTTDPVENTFPFFVKFDRPPEGLFVLKPSNSTDPTALFYEGVAPDWILTKGGILIRYLSGLAPSSRYVLTLGVFNA